MAEKCATLTTVGFLHPALWQVCSSLWSVQGSTLMSSSTQAIGYFSWISVLSPIKVTDPKAKFNRSRNEMQYTKAKSRYQTILK